MADVELVAAKLKTDEEHDANEVVESLESAETQDADCGNSSTACLDADTLSAQIFAQSAAPQMPGPSFEGNKDLSAYEMQRAMNILRNEQARTCAPTFNRHLNLCTLLISTPHFKILAELGLAQPAPSHTSKASRPRLPRVVAPISAAPRRLSARLRTSPPRSEAESPLASREEAEAEVPQELSLHDVDDSSVLRYICGAKPRECVEPASRTSADSMAGGVAWRQAWSAIAAAPVYCLACAAVQGTSHALLASGGKGGVLSLWGLEGDAPQEPLMQWRAGSSWVGDIRFCSQATSESTLLLSCANDATLKLWDVNKSTHRGKSEALSPRDEMAPHAAGIFGMDERAGRILTASKDRTVGLSLLTPSGLRTDRRIGSLHDAIVKAVRWRNANEFASAGADARVLLSDTRAADGGAIALAACHVKAVNALAWSPSDEALLLSSGFDAQLYLHDVRKPQAPLHAFAGHTLRQVQRGIHQPAFCFGGRCIVAVGDGSRLLSMYCASTGVTISRGELDDAAEGGTALLSVPLYAHETIMLANGKLLTSLVHAPK
ncbi:hypothetical protein AB1Y20_004828 [Prymnesium parvum]|uniref:Peroxin-7 n=1 Tax=Prymnesium parvum TaxID=97485 RepID=A0AB34J0A7_PRYPA